MPFAVEMLLDAEAEAGIRALWDAVANAGAPSRMRETGGRPHLCLAAAESVAVGPLEAELASFVREMPPLTVDFSGVGALGGAEGVAYLGVVPTRELLAIHDDFYPLFRTHAVSPSPRYEPDAWVPHCTLAFGLDRRDLAMAVEACLVGPLPLGARIVSVGLAELSTGRSRTLASYDCMA